MNEEKFERLCRLLRLDRGTRVLDIACGKGEFLVMLAELFDIVGVGVDISPYCIRECLDKKRARVPEADIKFIEMDGAEYEPESYESFDLAMCIGASGVFGGHRGALRKLKGMTRPGGLVAVGEPFWLKDPSEEYLRAEGMGREELGTHFDNVRVGEEEGLVCLYTLVSDHDYWDHYETFQWWAVDDYVRTHPDDPDNLELLEKTRIGKESYLRWGRDTQGWAIYVFRKAQRA